jgi:hypothetical protein
MMKLLIFAFGAYMSFIFTSAYYKPAHVRLDRAHSCDAAVKGCEEVAISVEHQLQKCEYSANRLIEILISCRDVSPECRKIFRESIE